MRRQAGDTGVIKTNDDAQATKLSCAAMGYFTDAILPLLHKAAPSRKPPIINRGTWARHAVFRQVTHDFITACTAATASLTHAAAAAHGSSTSSASGDINSSSNDGSGSRWEQPVCQVVTLGAGTDSSWFSLRQQAWELSPAAHFIELDFQEVVSKKARTLLSTPQLLGMLPDGTTAATAPVLVTTHNAAAAPSVTQAAAPTATAGAAAESAAAGGADDEGMPPPPPQLRQQQQQIPAVAAAAAPGGAGGLLSLSLRVPQQHDGNSSGSSSHPPMTWTKLAHLQGAASAASGGAQPSSSAASIPDVQQQQQQQHSSAADSSLGQQVTPAQPQQQQQHQQHCSSSECAGLSETLPHAQQQQQQHQSVTTTSSSHHSSGVQPPAAVLQHVQELTGQQYSLVAADLRSVDQFKAALARAGFRPHVPTLYLSECVLIYLEPGEAEAVLATAAAAAAEAGAPAAVAIYEQTRPDDAFGATMISNLKARGCPLRSVMAVPTPASQAQRLTSTGWTAAAAADMAAIYHAGGNSNTANGSGRLPNGAAPAAGAAVAAAAGGGGAAEGWLRPAWQAERRRIEGLELLDELEEWRLLQEHYCLALGVLGDGPNGGWLAEALRLQQLAALTK